MIFGIGTDIVQIARMQKNLDEHGDRFAKRILTDDEYSEYMQKSFQAHFLAKRFAAKEATAKAMGTGFSQGLSLQHIGVTHNDLGKPMLTFCDMAKQFMLDNEITDQHISLSDEKEYAVAFVTLVSSKI
jgi:holo-[acyl-carrier protein] synthase